MQTTPTSSIASAPATSEKKGSAAESPALAGDDFQTFLTLLTAQMRNQDPLKPVESTEFVSQLASFSAVEQQVRSNEQLERIFAALSKHSNGGLAEWIGREIRAPAAANYQGVPVELEVDPSDGADSATLIVRNAFDQVVDRRSVDPRASALTWDGQNALGESMPNGTYRFSVESYAGDTLLGAETGRVFNAVTEVRLVSGEPSLVLESGETVLVEDVTAVR